MKRRQAVPPRCKVRACGPSLRWPVSSVRSLAGRARAETAHPGQTPSRPTARRRRASALAVTLEALSPIAGIGAFYAHDTDRGLTLAIISTVAAGPAWGRRSGSSISATSRRRGGTALVQDAEQGTAISILATAAIVYVVARVSGLVLAPEATDAFNDQLRRTWASRPSRSCRSMRWPRGRC